MTTALVSDLSDPSNLPGNSHRVEHVETHASDVFLTDTEVFKTKKARDFGFLDFRTLTAREKDSRDEVRLNRRTAPSIYLEVLPVHRDASGHSLVRDGEIVDWAVRMKRLPDEQSTTALLKRGELTTTHLSAIARSIASFHRDQELRSPDPASMLANLEENFTQIGDFTPSIFDSSTVDSLVALQRAWYRDNESDLQRRPVIDGHGDLRLEHVYMTADGPIAIDCVEFLDRFRIADPGLDIAFYVMELIREGQPRLAEFFVARYAYETGDYGFYPLLNGYISYRALVRAKVACFVVASKECSPQVRSRKTASAKQHLQLAHELLDTNPTRPLLIAIGGMIGAGKTTVAEALSEAQGIPIVSADAARKDLAGLEHHQAGTEAIYTEAFSTRTYNEVWERAGQVLTSGRRVIVDTTFRRRVERDKAAQIARDKGADFLFIECTIDESTARARLRNRRLCLSDAREDLWESFVASYEPPDEISPEKSVKIHGSTPMEDVLNSLKGRI